jgi:hypothetical protein
MLASRGDRTSGGFSTIVCNRLGSPTPDSMFEWGKLNRKMVLENERGGRSRVYGTKTGGMVVHWIVL